jgi:hypothetical protein
MLNSKALKDFEIKERSKFYEMLIDPIVDKYHKVSWTVFGKPISHVKKLWDWYFKVFRYDYDFDGHCLFAIIEYKLKRIEKSLISGCALQENKDMKALKLAIRLAGRLKEDRYDERGYDRIDRKWGKAKYWFEPCNDGSGNSYMRSSKPNVKTEQDKTDELEYSRLQYKLSEDRMKREEKRLYDILFKYLRVWWD